MGANISLPAHTDSLQLGLSDDAYPYDGDVYYDADNDLQADWLQVPDDVMKLIIQRLDTIDRARMCFVCKPWRFLAMQKEIPVPPQFPWLMFSPTPNQFPIWPSCKQQVISFFDRIQGKTHNYTLPKSVKGGWCFGSSKGWLFIAKGSKKKPQIFLLDPISAKIIPLPPITTIPSYYQYLDEYKDAYDFSYFINKLHLYFFGEDEDVSSCTVVAMLNHREVLATCKPHDDKWIAIQAKDMFLDMSFYKGILYVLSPFHDDNTTVSNLNLGTIPIKLVFDAPPVMVEKVGEEYDIEGAYLVESITRNGSSDDHLVESRGELLKIVMNFNVLETEIMLNNDHNVNVFKYLQTSQSEVYKMDHDGKFEVYKMDCGDDQALFIGGIGSSLSISAKDFNGVKGNCIHFLDEFDYRSCSNFDPIVGRESGILFLKDGKIIRSYPSRNCPARLSWFTPLFPFTS